jgi:sugar phosphate isomerase/epimerase
VNFPALLGKLKALGYDGSLTIEREITGKQQLKDILEAQSYLNMLIKEN